MKNIDVAVLGYGGFIGQELVDTLKKHPRVDNIHTPTREELPEFEGSEVIFSALPPGKSAKQVTRFLRLGSTILDFAGDSRFQTAPEYEKWYGQPHPAPEILPVPYGLPEHSRDQLQGQPLVAIPGCYPTGALLALRPLVDKGLIQTDTTIIVNADSGVSGAGKEPTELTSYMNMSGNAVSYKTGRQHRHVGEIEQFLDGRSIFFSPTVIPIERGMLVKVNAHLVDGTTQQDVHNVLGTAYRKEPFTHVLPEEKIPEIKETTYTDECHIGAVVVGNTLQTGSSLDNLRKGGSSQGIHVFNIVLGFPETTGLTPKSSMQS